MGGSTGSPPLFSMKTKTLEKLNRHFDQFGRNPHGGLNFKWQRAQDTFYMYGTGEYEETRSPGGVIYMAERYEKHTFARLYGDVWFLVTWKPPQYDHEEWARQFGNAFPWPRHGEYLPIESTVLPVGTEPDEQLTIYTIFKLRQHLALKYGDHLADAQLAVDQAKAAEKAEWSDIVDDAAPAFGNIPGEKGHVSFPSVAPAA